jgi:hypothetical protein
MEFHMSIQLGTQFSFPIELVAGAVAFPTGHYVEVDDELFTANGLGRKIVQTQQVRLHGRDVSVGYINEEGTQYGLVMTVENPVPLGAFDDVARANQALFDALHEAFGGKIGSYAHHEMVMAISRAKSLGVVPTDMAAVRQAASWARSAYKRAAWIFKNPMEAAIETPVDWTAKGL